MVWIVFSLLAAFLWAIGNLFHRHVHVAHIRHPAVIMWALALKKLLPGTLSELQTPRIITQKVIALCCTITGVYMLFA